MKTVKIYASNHDIGAKNVGPMNRPANDYQRTVELLKQCGYKTAEVK